MHRSQRVEAGWLTVPCSGRARLPAGVSQASRPLPLPCLHRPGQAEVSDDGLAALAGLTRLQSLHLGGGACGVGERACAAFARHLRGLTALQVTDCPSLGDSGLFRLAPLAPGLLRLGLSGCGGVTDIGLAAVLRGAGRQAGALAC